MLARSPSVKCINEKYRIHFVVSDGLKIYYEFPIFYNYLKIYMFRYLSHYLKIYLSFTG